MRKQGDGYVILSEESITLMTPYGGLSIYLLTVADPSHSFRMTPFVLHHYDASRSPLLVTCSLKIVILNGGKNALWERREAER